MKKCSNYITDNIRGILMNSELEILTLADYYEKFEKTAVKPIDNK